MKIEYEKSDAPITAIYADLDAPGDYCRVTGIGQDVDQMVAVYIGDNNPDDDFIWLTPPELEEAIAVLTAAREEIGRRNLPNSTERNR